MCALTSSVPPAGRRAARDTSPVQSRSLSYPAQYALPPRHHGASSLASDGLACLDTDSSPIESVGGGKIWWARCVSPVSRRTLIFIEQPQQQQPQPQQQVWRSNPGNRNVDANRSSR